MSSIKLIGQFDRYTPINEDPHYVFKTENERYLIRCVDYPNLMSQLSPQDLVNIEADVLDEEEQSSQGIKLVNVKFGVINE